MNNAINMVSDADPYKEKMCYAFYVLLEEKNKLGILDMSMDGPYVKYIGRKMNLQNRIWSTNRLSRICKN